MKPYRRSKSIRPLIAALAAVAAGAVYYIFINSPTTTPPQALARAAAAVSRGEFHKIEPLLSVAETEPLIKNWALLLRGQSASAKGNLDLAAKSYQAIPPSHPAYLDAQTALLKFSADLNSDYSEELADALVKNAKGAGRPELAAQLMLEKAELADPQDRCSLLMEVRKAYPLSEAAGLAREQMTAESESGKPLCQSMTVTQIFETVDQLVREQQHDAALSEIQRAVGISDENSEAALTALLREERILRKLRRHEEADHLLLVISADGAQGTADEALLRTAKNAWNVNHHDRALTFLEKLIERFPESPLRSEANYILGRVLEEKGLFADAKEAYSREAKSTAADETQLKSTLRTAWLYAVSGDYLHAAQQFIRLRNQTERSELNTATLRPYLAHALYWEHVFTSKLATEQLKSLEGGAGSEELKKAFGNRMTPEFESIQLVEMLGPEKFDPIWNQLLGKDSEDDTERCTISMPATLRHTLTVLSTADLHEFVRREINWAIRLLPESSAGDFAAAATKAKLFSDFGLYHESSTSAEVALDLVRDQKELQHCAALMLRYSYPRAFENLAASAAKRSDLPLPLLLALVRTESRFNPRAVSTAGARGLAQLMAETAKEEGMKDGDDLFDPEVNLSLGAQHLRRLMNNYDEAVYAIAAYNAGAAAVNRWKTRSPKLPPEQWIERIGYPETKAYVKKVLAAWKVYQRLESTE